MASYIPVVVSRGLAFVAGQVPIESGKPLVTGRLGEEITTEDGADWARRCALQILSALRAELGSLDRVTRIVKVGVFVACTEDYTEQPKVGNGASDLFAEVFGESGKHARAAVGVTSLPLGVPVEVDLVAEVSD